MQAISYKLNFRVDENDWDSINEGAGQEVSWRQGAPAFLTGSALVL